jgi:hypothetical protein
MPKDLTGTLYRNGPNPQFALWGAHCHWLLGASLDPARTEAGGGLGTRHGQPVMASESLPMPDYLAGAESRGRRVPRAHVRRRVFRRVPSAGVICGALRAADLSLPSPENTAVALLPNSVAPTMGNERKNVYGPKKRGNPRRFGRPRRSDRLFAGLRRRDPDRACLSNAPLS